MIATIIILSQTHQPMITKKKATSLLKISQLPSTSTSTSLCPQPLITNITDCSRGVDQLVKIITYINKGQEEEKKVVIKYPKEEPDKIGNQWIGCWYAGKMGVPVPEVYYVGEEFLVESFVQGTIMKEVMATPRAFKKMYYNLGKYLKQIHKNKGHGYGKIPNPNLQTLNAQSPTTTPLKKSISQQLQALHKKNHYPKKWLKSISTYITENQYLLDLHKGKTTCLLHGDYCEDNIIVKGKGQGLEEGEIGAVVDFGDLGMGHAMEDFVRLYVRNFGCYKWQALVQGYGDYDIRVIEYYTVYFCLWRINSQLQKNNHRGPIRQLEKTLKRIIPNP